MISVAAASNNIIELIKNRFVNLITKYIRRDVSEWKALRLSLCEIGRNKIIQKLKS